MKKLISAFALPLLGMILCSCASEQPASTTTTTTTTQQRQTTLPQNTNNPSGMTTHGGM
jgi:hypothetical protein